MASFAQFGNDLFTGRRQVNFIGRRRTWYVLTGILLIIAAVGLFGRGLNFSLEFKGGSEFRVSGVSNTDNYEARARDAAGVAESGVNVTLIGGSTVRVQTEKLTDTESAQVASALAKEFGVPEENVSSTFIGPSWGATVSQKALQALVIFLLQGLHELGDMATVDVALQGLGIELLHFGVVAGEALLRVRDEDAAVRGTLHGAEDTGTGRGAPISRPIR